MNSPMIPPMHYDVCPNCKRETTRHAFFIPEGPMIETHHCPEHGDVVPMRSVIVNHYPELDWSAA